MGMGELMIGKWFDECLNWFEGNWSMWLRWFLYVSVAVSTSILAETSMSSLPVVWSVSLKAGLQGLIAWRAFLDETPAWTRIKKEKAATAETNVMKID